jgi:hypothetical protein
MLAVAGRLPAAAAILGPCLLLLTSLQTALYPTATPPDPSPLPAPLVAGAILAAGALRVVRRTTFVHVVFLAILVCGVAFLAAHLGSPLANASGDYCGDFCRSAIMGRFLVYFGWPIVTAVGLTIFGRWERPRPEVGSAERAAWSWTWAAVALALGTLASVAWWRIILPKG